LVEIRRIGSQSLVDPRAVIRVNAFQPRVWILVELSALLTCDLFVSGIYVINLSSLRSGDEKYFVDVFG